MKTFTEILGKYPIAIDHEKNEVAFGDGCICKERTCMCEPKVILTENFAGGLIALINGNYPLITGKYFFNLLKNMINSLNKIINSFLSRRKMGIRLGKFDPLQLIFGIIDALLRNNSITEQDAKTLIKRALPPEMSDEERNEIVNSFFETPN